MRKLLIILSPLIIMVIGILFHFMTKGANEYEKRDFPQINKDKTLSIVTNLDLTGYYVSGDTISGFNYELLNALQRYTPIQFEISLENSLEKSFEGLSSGKYDLIARNIPVNSELRNEYDFTTPVIYNKLVLVQRKAEYNNGKKPIRNHLDMGNISIHVPKESPAIFRLKNLSHEIGDTIFVTEDDTYEYMQLSLMVASGDIDYTVSDSRTAQKISSRIPELDVKTDIGFTHLEAWATRKNSTQLTDSLNAWLEQFSKTNEYQLLVDKYNKLTK